MPDWRRLDRGRGPQCRGIGNTQEAPLPPPQKKNVLNALREKEGAERPLSWEGEVGGSFGPRGKHERREGAQIHGGAQSR